MTEKDWMKLLAENPPDILPVLRDWYLEREDSAAVAFCEWLQWRLTCVKKVGLIKSVGEKTGRLRYWWWASSAENYLLGGQHRLVSDGNELPAPLFRHGLETEKRVPHAGVDFDSLEDAWGAAFAAWRNAFVAGALEPFLHNTGVRR